jgi:hypothetical protein
MLVIPTDWEVEIGRIWLKDSLGKKLVRPPPISTNKLGMVAHVPATWEAKGAGLWSRPA